MKQYVANIYGEECCMEIERKFLVKSIPKRLEQYDSLRIEQGYLCTEPVVRIRRQDNEYYLTYKSIGFLSREEYNLPLDKKSYHHLIKKTDGNIISKVRYKIPLEDNLIAELDIFSGKFESLVLIEVEFCSEEEAVCFIPPDWFGEDVTYQPEYQNNYLSTI